MNARHVIMNRIRMMKMKKEGQKIVPPVNMKKVQKYGHIVQISQEIHIKENLIKTKNNLK